MAGRQRLRAADAPWLEPTAHIRPLVDLCRDAATAAGHALRIATSLPLVVADTDTEAEHLADRHIAHHLEVWREAMESWNGHEPGEHPDNVRKLAGIGPEHIRDNNGAIVGSPATVAARILRLVRDFGGVDQILWQVDIGTMPLARARRSIELFRDAVVPLLREKVAALRAGVRLQAAVAG
nr:LLM class flavin-dependent oxidoreductase [Streptomyces noursei]